MKAHAITVAVLTVVLSFVSVPFWVSDETFELIVASILGLLDAGVVFIAVLGFYLGTLDFVREMRAQRDQGCDP